ncbi:hypothetical protein SAMN05421678_11847 [Actinopolymorpha cephalotaxi]|uniref:Uncharacterized protein n=1 Tax=Actinopolymorpha cephalotaxi TaxID=504797 RepID=A0A1I3A5H1_9ACTN|nr:hypothetical protein [Actinopolymorpha cephalotaxi]NYH85340.1 hypothetical protein [Actinopolymorpha cephalotaxi]SFH45150.1 hypothetical protein SAMN05421678_11847 [Actinopolymorpha cephalotaxi]
MTDTSPARRVVGELDLTVEQRRALAEAAVSTVAVEVYRQLQMQGQGTDDMAGSCAIIGNCSGGPGCDIIGNCSSSKLVSVEELI